ncbi:hypothetical protein [Marinobacter confluentis]|uniref:Uncharacterized protein n=1 Tax=Marinobacter confluentis TaxID=1697557 RepID=A0A4Z1C8X2_9GAMM|nr:hypothetical protein [Marinobacter confluentis]TGN39498.1 hypothetical protein E5Q11_12820 [Marinobacter confluentis]
MDFLCPAHRNQFSELPLKERHDLWLFWMESARSMIENGEWRDVVSLVGSAFDLACLHPQGEQPQMHTELTLSAILVFRVLSDLGERSAAEQVFYRALDSLPSDPTHLTLPQRVQVKDCVEVLLNTGRQSDFFLKHLDWRALPIGQSRSCRVRVVH